MRNGGWKKIVVCKTARQAHSQKIIHIFSQRKVARGVINGYLWTQKVDHKINTFIFLHTYFGCIIHMTLWLLYNVHNDKSIDCRAIIVSLNPRPICGKTHHTILGPTSYEVAYFQNRCRGWNKSSPQIKYNFYSFSCQI